MAIFAFAVLCGPKTKEDSASIQGVCLRVSARESDTTEFATAAVSLVHLDKTIRTKLTRAGNRQGVSRMRSSFEVRLHQKYYLALT